MIFVRCEQSFIVMGGERIQIAFRWRADDGPTLNAGLVTL